MKQEAGDYYVGSWYKSLDVKNILLEIVSHHILPQMLTSPLLVDTSDLLKGYSRFMDEHFKESADLTFLAYRHRNYSKAIEFVQFNERLQCLSRIEEAERNGVKETESKVTRTIKKRSLLPRMIHLSIQCASSSVKVNSSSDINGFHSKASSELKSLLESYAKFLQLPFHDAVELVTSVASGQKPLEVFSPNLIDWMNFAVCLNAWNLNSNGITIPMNWELLCSLLQQSVSSKIKTAKPLVSFPGTNLSILVQLVTEPLRWHGLIIQSCVRSALPSGTIMTEKKTNQN
ncbi:unnamed protein product [Lactuca virosa]|uniref:Uncharacterized protein n=1 Tax=Lactuca virosa TaxID=75947 RepID=A0AAU9PAX2_9ASTR|nr:unnamed protein product [Lactuca virosa]